MTTRLPTTAIKVSDMRNIAGKTGAISLTTIKFWISNIPNTNTVKISTFAGQRKKFVEGFTYKVFTSGYFADDVNWFKSKTENYRGITADMTNVNTSTGGVVPLGSSWGAHSIEWFGYFCAPETATYTFYTASDDASYVWIGDTALNGYRIGNCVVNNGGSHGRTERSGTMALIKGSFYPIRVQYGAGGYGDNFDFSFSTPNIARTYNFVGIVFSSFGTDSNMPAESALTIKTASSTQLDDTYYINLNGTSTLTYCLLDNKWDNGGWMMLMKAKRGDTFNYNSTYWTDANTTLNPTDLTRNDGDAKYDVMNKAYIKDTMAIWPDVGSTGGSIADTGTWNWYVYNFWDGLTTRVTPITGFSTNARTSHIGSDATSFSGFSTSIWSYQSPDKAHVFAGVGHLYGISTTMNARWGFIFNENGNWGSPDVVGGIGMTGSWNGWSQAYSAGDAYGCCGSAGLNRTMRVELYGR